MWQREYFACYLFRFDFRSWLRFDSGLKAQERRSGFLPVTARFQPFCGWYGLIAALFTSVFCGYQLFTPGQFSAPDFIFAYGAFFISITLFIVYKVMAVIRGKQRWLGVPASELDFVTGVDEIERFTTFYEADRWAAERKWWSRVYSKLF